MKSKLFLLSVTLVFGWVCFTGCASMEHGRAMPAAHEFPKEQRAILQLAPKIVLHEIDGQRGPGFDDHFMLSKNPFRGTTTYYFPAGRHELVVSYVGACTRPWRNAEENWFGFSSKAISFEARAGGAYLVDGDLTQHGSRPVIHQLKPDDNPYLSY